MSQHGTAGMEKHVTLTIPQKLEEAWKWQKLKCVYFFIQHGIINCLWSKEMEEPIMSIYDIKWKRERPFQATDTKGA
jgi:hypothetical protein